MLSTEIMDAIHRCCCLFAGLYITRRKLKRRLKALAAMDKSKRTLDQIALNVQEILDLYVSETKLIVYVPMSYTVDRLALLITESEFDEYLAVCKALNLFGPAVIAALSMQTVEAVPDLVKQLPLALLCELAWYLHAKGDRWSCLKTLLESRADLALDCMLTKMAMSSLDDDDDNSAVFMLLVERCSKSVVLRHVVHHVTRNGLVRQFQVLVDCRRVDHRKGALSALSPSTGNPVLVDLVRDVTRLCRCCRFQPRTRADIDECMLIAGRSGLFTDDRAQRLLDNDNDDGDDSLAAASPQRTVMGIAAFHRRLDVVRFLHSCGAACNSELFRLSRCQVLRKKLETSTCSTFSRTARDVAAFIADAASTVRPLESLCIREVSRLLGSGKARGEKLDRLALPGPFKRQLSLEDAVEEYRKGLSELCRVSACATVWSSRN